MNDEKLLLLAAKGAGYEVLATNRGPDEESFSLQIKLPSGKIVTFWNSLVYNSDAFKLIIDAPLFVSKRMAEILDEKGEFFIEFKGDKEGLDDYAQTRRAVTRAVAEFGARGEK